MIKRLLVICVLLTGCERVSMPEVTTTFVAAGGAAASTVIWANPVSAAVGAAVGGMAGANLTKDDKSVTTEQIAQVENPWQALVLAFDQMLNHAFELVIAVSLAIIGIPMLLSYLLGRFKQRPEDRKAIADLVEKIGKMKE
jgi:hypothetical protein